MTLIKNSLIKMMVFITVITGNAIVGIYGLLFSCPIDKTKTDLEKKNFNKVLIIKLWAIGEVCTATPVIRELKSNFPNMSLNFLVGKRSSDIIKNNPHIDEVIVVDEEIFLNFNLVEIFKLIKNLKVKRFDIAIVLHHSFLFTIFAWLIGAKTRVGFDRNGEGFLNNVKICPLFSDKRLSKKHRVDRYLAAVEALGGKVRDRNLEVFPTLEDERFVEDFLEENDVTKDDVLIGIMPTGGKNPAAQRIGARLERKVWPTEYYAELSKMLVEGLKAKIIVLGGVDELEKAQVIKSRIRENLIDTTSKLNLRQLNSAAQRCSLIITNDSGPMFVVSASDVPLVAIFGPTDPFLCGPFSKNSYIINKNIGCGPCLREDVFPNVVKKCNKKTACMNSIEPKEVFEIIKNKLQIEKGKK